MSRDRSEGWTHAKRSGHKNEEILADLLTNNTDFAAQLSSRLGKPKLVRACAGGINERNVECVLGGSTPSKTDLIVQWEDNSTTNISVKKSRNGQVFLVTPERFISGFEIHYNAIPNAIKSAIKMSFGSYDQTLAVLSNTSNPLPVSERTRKYEIKRKRVTANTLKAYNSTLYDDLLQWFKREIVNISDFCFSKGLAKDSNSWADYLWYVNMIDEDEENCNRLFYLPDLFNSLSLKSNHIVYGSQNGGSTIQLPFGFLQWHLKCLQFHHGLLKLSAEDGFV